MNFKETLRPEGRQKGRQEGLQESALAIAKKMLAEGSESSFVKKVTGLFDEDIKKIAP